MKKIIKDLNRLYKELKPYQDAGTFLLGSRELPSKFVFYGLPALYIDHQNGEFVFAVDTDEISDEEFDRLVNQLSASRYQQLADMQAIICNHAKRIKQFVFLRDLFDSVYLPNSNSRKTLRVALFRREIPYEYKLPSSEISTDLPVEEPAQAVESENEEGSACSGVCLSCCGDNQ